MAVQYITTSIREEDVAAHCIREEGVAPHAWYKGGGCGATHLVWVWKCEEPNALYGYERAWCHTPCLENEGVTSHTLYGYERAWCHTPCLKNEGVTPHALYGEGECGVTHLVWVWKGVVPHHLYGK
jgi:hypothetical protein